MCEFCTNPKQAAKDAKFTADLLERLAGKYRAMADGRIKPHGADAEAVQTTARLAVRNVVADWI